jgi:hypothetical protein
MRQRARIEVIQDGLLIIILDLTDANTTTRLPGTDTAQRQRRDPFSKHT